MSHDANHESFILLCSGCATEAGLNDDEHVFGPIGGEVDLACQRCSAVLVGFAYRVPADTYTGMTVGAG